MNKLNLLLVLLLSFSIFFTSCSNSEEVKEEEITEESTSDAEEESSEENSSENTAEESEAEETADIKNTDDPEAWAAANAEKFMRFYKGNDIASAVDGCHPKAFEFDERKQWMKVLNDLLDNIGIIENYTLYDEGSDYGEGQAGEGYYYEYLYEANHVEKTLYAKLILFHENEGEEPKVLGYFYQENKDDLQLTTK